MTTLLCYAIPLGTLALFIAYRIGYGNGRCDAIHSRITYDLHTPACRFVAGQKGAEK